MHADARHTLHTSLEQALGPEPAVILMDALDACATKQDLRTLKRELVHELDLRFGVVDEQFHTVTEQFRSVEERFSSMDRSMTERFNAMDRTMDERFGSVEERFRSLDRTLAERFGTGDERFKQADERFTRIEAALDRINDRLDGLYAEIRSTSRTLFFQVTGLQVAFLGAVAVLVK